MQNIFNTPNIFNSQIYIRLRKDFFPLINNECLETLIDNIAKVHKYDDLGKPILDSNGNPCRKRVKKMLLRSANSFIRKLELIPADETMYYEISLNQFSNLIQTTHRKKICISAYTFILLYKIREYIDTPKNPNLINDIQAVDGLAEYIHNMLYEYTRYADETTIYNNLCKFALDSYIKLFEAIQSNNYSMLPSEHPAKLYKYHL